MNDGRVSLDDADIARLHQVALGLLDPGALPPAEVYVDSEGNEIARYTSGGIDLREPSPWPAPASVRTDAPVVVAVPEQLPVGTLPSADAVLLLPTAGVRVDDARFVTWAHAWRAIASTVIEIPFTPYDALTRAGELVAAYSTADRIDIATVAQPECGGQVVFFTGFSGSGKSTIARTLVTRLVEQRPVTLLDGDVVRTHLSRGLGFSREDRDTNIRRIGWVAAEVAKHGGIAVCAPIAPYDETRRWVRRTVDAAAGAGSFVLVWVSTPLEVCEARDVKGLYARARAGDIRGFTGIDDPYEPPTDADIVIDTSAVTLDEAVDIVLAAIATNSAAGGPE
ncbi:MAG: sulfate adenylyltransferase [Frankiaceae bacterium]|nr:sulfate adenylyltransferase [Frankiaceae bacterium]